MSLPKWFLAIVLVLFGCIPQEVIASVKAERLVEATVEMYDGMHLWSGAIIDRQDGKLVILSVMHDDPNIKAAIDEGLYTVLVRIDDEEVLVAHLVKWNQCAELALFIVEDKHMHSVVRIALWDISVGDIVSTAGNALGFGIRFNKGYISDVDIVGQQCINWSMYSGGVISGQTGSPLVNSRNKLIGILTAVATKPINVLIDGIPTPLVEVDVPVYYLGYFVPLKTIKEFTKGIELENLENLT